MILSLNCQELAKVAVLAVEKLDCFLEKNECTASLESIRQQMIFIRDKSLQGINPISALGENRTFTYRIIASREFSSPEELEVKFYIDRVSNLLDPD